MRKSVTILLLALAAATMLVISPSFAQTQDSRLKKAQIFIQAGNYKEAIDLLEKVVQSEPSDADVRYLLGLAYTGAKDIDKAITQFERVLTINGDFEETYVRLASLHAEKKNFDKAHKVIDLLMTKNAKSFLGRYARGVLFYQQQKIPEAIAEFSQTIVMDKTFTPAYANLGVIYYNQRKFDESLKNFCAAALAAPEDPEYPFSAGWVNYKKGNKTEAYRYFNQASRMRPPHVYSCMEKACTAYDAGKLEDAEKALGEVFTMSPEFPQGMYLHGKILIQQKKYKEAEELVKVMLTSDPLDADAKELDEVLQPLLKTENEKEKATVSPEQPENKTDGKTDGNVEGKNDGKIDGKSSGESGGKSENKPPEKGGDSPNAGDPPKSDK